MSKKVEKIGNYLSKREMPEFMIPEMEQFG